MTDWLQAGGNAARTGYTPDALGSNLAVDWRADFGGGALHECVAHRVQVVVGGGVLIVPTMPGRVYGFQATAPTIATRATGWPTVGYVALGAPAVTTPALDATYAHVPTLDGNVHAVRLADGTVARTHASVNGSRLGNITAAPLLAGSPAQLILADHRGQVTSLDPTSYVVNWTYQVNNVAGYAVPLRMAPAYDGTRVILGRLDMHVEALTLSSHTRAWTTETTLLGGPWSPVDGAAGRGLCGAGFTEYWPVCLANNLVVLRPVAKYNDNGDRPWASTNPLYRGVPAEGWLGAGVQAATLAEVDAHPERYAPNLHVLRSDTGALQPYPVHFGWRQWMHGAGQPVAALGTNGTVIIAGQPPTTTQGATLFLDLNPVSGTYRQITDWTTRADNRDENVTHMGAGAQAVIMHSLGFNNALQPHLYPPYTPLPDDISGAVMGAASEPNAAVSPIVVGAWMYHLASNQLAARNTA